jgi:hypothetical protein
MTGAEGDWGTAAVTVTIAVAVDVPPLFVAVSLYTVV